MLFGPSVLRLVLLALGLLTNGGTSAAVLDNESLKQQYGPALVRIEAKDAPKRSPRGFGVVISKEGHVLTVGHVLNGLAPDAIVGRRFGKDGSPTETLIKLTEVGRFSIDPREVLVVLKFDGDFDRDMSPPALGSATDPAYGPFRLLTGSSQLDDVVAITLDLTLSKRNLEELRGSINEGTSGSPVLDKWGNVVGVVVAGLPGETTAFAVNLANQAGSLKKLGVPINDELAAPVRLAVYLRVNESRLAPSTAAELVKDLRLPLTNAFGTAQDFVKGEMEVYTPQDSIPVWETLASRIFNETSSRTDIESFLNGPQQKGWIAGQDYGLVYLLIIDIQDVNVLKWALLVIDNHISKVILRDFVTHPVVFESTPSPELLYSETVKILHLIFRMRPRWGQNGLLLADCFEIRAMGSDKSWMFAMPEIPEIFGDNLRTVWSGNVSDRTYQVKSALRETCLKNTGATSRLFRKDDLSEILIGARIYPESNALRWWVVHPWDELGRFADDMPTPNIVDYRSAKEVARALALEVVKRWSDVLKKIDH